MSTRSERRVPHVRPRPPSDGRPHPPRIAPRPPASGRLAGHRPVRTAATLPWPARVLLVVAIGALGVAVVLAGTGALGRAVGSLGGAASAFLSKLAAPSQAPTAAPIIEAPTLTPPDQQATNQPTVEIDGTVPGNVVGSSAYAIRLYVSHGGTAATLVREIAVPSTPAFAIPNVTLAKGTNDFSATLIDTSTHRETDPSPSIRYVLDTAAPTIKVTSPKSGAVLNVATTAIQGTTKAGSTIVARNAANGVSATATASSAGAFSLSLALLPGPNAITLTATDPAGNVGTASISLTRSSGHLGVTLRSSVYRFSASTPSQAITLTAVATDVNGGPLVGATVTFTLTVPGVTALVPTSVTTDATGTATFTFTVSGATPGNGLATALVQSTTEGQVSARAGIVVTQ